MRSLPDATPYRELVLDSSWGQIGLVLDEQQRVVRLRLPFLRTRPGGAFALCGGASGVFLPGSPGTAHPCRTGRNRRPCGRLSDLVGLFAYADPAGTPFQKLIWGALSTVEPGTTCTYSELAAAAGSPGAARAAGSACGANPLPIFIPCHRAVARNGPGGFSAGLPWKQLLQEEERTGYDPVKNS